MDNSYFDIEVQEKVAGVASGMQLPLNFLGFGEIENSDVKVYIKQTTFKALEKLALSDTSKETGSIMLGNYCEELGKTHIIISDYIEAKYTDASASTLTFTHETWDYVHKMHEENHPDKRIVGWQHTHPNYGIFLSNYDLFIQENFFNLPFQVAYVIDPIQKLRGFFQWKNGKIVKLKCYYIYDEIGKPIKIEQTKIENKSDSLNPKSDKKLYALITALCFIIFALSFSSISLKNKYDEHIRNQQTILNEISNQKTVIDNQSTAIVKLQEQLVSCVLDNSGKTTANYLIKMLESQEMTLPNQEEVLAKLKAFVEKEDSNKVEFIVYTATSGDSLSSICEKNGINYYANKNIILSINGIEDANQIYVGQNILLPAS
ncbi:MAG: LysM peptidoglycan-binding domain-containing protein [Acutalibacteraceae bacterium]